MTTDFLTISITSRPYPEASELTLDPILFSIVCSAFIDQVEVAHKENPVPKLIKIINSL